MSDLNSFTTISMPRQIRVQYPGAIYHVMSRGDRREAIFHDDVDRQDFPEHPPSWIRTDRLLGEHGIREGNAASRQKFEAR